MNHFDEMACLLYLEGQLEPASAEQLRQHTATCDACRKLMRALERESLALTSALIEENESVPVRLLAPGRSVAAWVWVAACGLLAACVYWIWMDSINPWLEQLGNAGFDAIDFISMFFFSAAFWEGWADMIDLLQFAALIIAGGVAFQLVRRRISRPATTAIVMSAAFLAIGMPQSASAAEVRHGQSVVVAESETVHNDLIVAAQSVRIDGTIEGDVIAFTRDLRVSGHVTGDVIALAGQVRVEGVVDGNIRVGSNSVTVTGTVRKNVTSLANTLELTSKGQIGGGLIVLGSNVTLDGTIHRDLLGLAGRTDLDGPINGEVWLRGGNLAIASSASIGGPATFEGRTQPVVATGAKLASPVHVEITQQVQRYRVSVAGQVFRKILGYVAALLLGLLLVTVFPGFFRATMKETNRIGAPIGVGALTLITGVFLIVFAILLILVGSGAGIAAVLLYGPVLYLSQVFVAAWLGNKILGAPPDIPGVIVARIALGLLIITVATAIPIFGGIVGLAVLMWGSGAILLGFYRMSRNGVIPAVAA
jgi:cytoskeletal protein CcmA (bactofilin family)